MSQSKQAVNERHRRYYAKHRDAQLARGRRYYAEHKDMQQVRSCAYYAENKAAIRARAKERREKNKDAFRERARVYRLANVERFRAAARRSKAKNKEKIKAQGVEYRARTREARLLKNKQKYAENPTPFSERSRRYNRGQKELIIARYGGRCACCGELDHDFLTLDHVGGGGSKHRKEVKGGQAVYRWLIKNGFPPGFRILCFNCNMSSHFNKGKCAHEIRGATAVVQLSL